MTSCLLSPQSRSMLTPSRSSPSLPQLASVRALKRARSLPLLAQLRRLSTSDAVSSSDFNGPGEQLTLATDRSQLQASPANGTAHNHALGDQDDAHVNGHGRTDADVFQNPAWSEHSSFKIPRATFDRLRADFFNNTTSEILIYDHHFPFCFSLFRSRDSIKCKCIKRLDIP